MIDIIMRNVNTSTNFNFYVKYLLINKKKHTFGKQENTFKPLKLNYLYSKYKPLSLKTGYFPPKNQKLVSYFPLTFTRYPFKSSVAIQMTGVIT